MKSKLLLFFVLACLLFLEGISQNLQRQGEKPNTNFFSDNSLSITPMSAGITAEDMVENLLGEGISYSNLEYTGASVASGLFAGGLLAGINIEDGVILSSGAAEFAIGPNNSPGISQSNSLPGDPDLDDLGYSTNDASILEFDFIPELDYITFNFVLGSEEYPEYITQYQDVFAFFLDGENIALIPGTNTTISIGTVNHLENSEYYIGNSDSPPLYDVQCDGFTTVFELYADVTPNVEHHIKMTVADVNDHALDTWIFLEGGSFVSANPAIAVDPSTLSASLCSNSISVQNMEISNTGTGELTFEIVNLPAWLSAVPLTGTIAEGENTQVELTFNSSGLGSNTYQSNFSINNNTPNSPLDVPVTLEVIPATSSYFVNEDNEDNQQSGFPDNDFDEFLCKGDGKLPIEFRITVDHPVITSAQLSLVTFDMDAQPGLALPYAQKDEVYVNGNLIGVLTGANEQEETTVLDVPAAYLIPGPNGINIIEIRVSVLGKFWCLEMRSAELIVNNCP